MTTDRPSWQERLYRRAAADENGCWLWQGKSFTPKGYVRFYGAAGTPEVQVSYAHRWSYIAAHGSIPAGLEIDHLCNVRHCINPAHLEAVTQAENARRRGERKSHCNYGHERTEENTYRSRNGWSACRPCKLARMAQVRAA